MSASRTLNPSAGSVWSRSNAALFRYERQRHDFNDRAVPDDMMAQIAAFPKERITPCPPGSHASQFGQTLTGTRSAGGQVYGRGRAQ